MKYKSVLIACLITLKALSQQSSRLNEGWEFLRQDIGGIWEAVRPVVKVNPEGVPLWDSVRLPHCFNATDAVNPDVNYYQGPGWYRKHLSLFNPYQNGRTILHFEGAGQVTDVYVYTQKVGTHQGGYDEWSVDITDAVRQFLGNDSLVKRFGGRVPVSVRCDNSRNLELIPSNLSDFNVYGGLYRYVNLVYQPSYYTSALFVKPTVSGNVGILQVAAEFSSPEAIKKGRITVFDPLGKKLQTLAAASFPVDLRIPKPALWWPDHPNLYTVELVLENGHRTVAKFGFRSFRFEENGPFILNGQRLLLRGTHRHEDHAGVAAAMTEDMIREEMILIRQMGVNFIRLGHYQQSRIVLDLCDSLGMVVWEEIPWCRGGLGGASYKAMARSMLANMISQHFNHPSVIIWGLGNENDWPGDFETFEKEEIRNFMKELNDLSHRLDSTRKTAIRRCDFCKDIVDVYSPSIWAGWYRGFFTEYKNFSETEAKKVKHFLHVEWGGDSHWGRHSSEADALLLSGLHSDGNFAEAAKGMKTGDWNETYACNLVDWHLKEQETMPWLTGTAQWAFKDFSTPVRPDNPIPYMNQKGVVTRDGSKKEVFYVFQSYWTTKPMIHLYGHTWPLRTGKPGSTTLIKAYSNCTEAELFVNGKSQGIRKRNSADYPAAGLRWELALERGQQVMHVVGRNGRETVRDTVSFFYETNVAGEPASLRLQAQTLASGDVQVSVTLVDDKGNLCANARNWVRFSIAGDSQMRADQGTPNGSSLIQLSNGYACLNFSRGKGVVAVSSPGLKTAFIELNP